MSPIENVSETASKNMLCIILKLNFKDKVLSTRLDHNGEEGEEELTVLQPRYPWEGSDRDYKYEEVVLVLLCSFFYSR